MGKTNYQPHFDTDQKFKDKKMIMDREWFRAALRVIGVMISVISASQSLAQGSNGGTLNILKSITMEEARRSDPFAVLHDKPMSESAALLPQLIASANTSQPMYLYEIARRLWPTDQAAAFEWFTVAMARARYDALRCVDKTSHQAILSLPFIAEEVSKGIAANRKLFGEAGLRALERKDLFVDSGYPILICSHGMAAVTAALQNRQLTARDWLLPVSEWESIQAFVRKDIAEYLEGQTKPQDDPIPMTTKTYSRQILPSAFSGSYAWLDGERLLVSSPEKGNDGKSQLRLATFDGKANREDVATTTGIWCAGNGVVSYQTGQEMLDGNLLRVALSSGKPGKWTQSSMELRTPFLHISGMQGFSSSWSMPVNSIRQSPFDCRWEQNEQLSGPKNSISWVPLLSGDGVIQGDSTGGLQWVTAKGELIKLPVSMRNVSWESFRYLAWKRAYFVAQTWARLRHQEKTLPTCIPGALIFPDQGRVEEVCAPLDSNNTSNAVIFAQSKLGWLRAATDRNTAQGRKPGGLYLIRPDGGAEKLMETTISTWSVDPEGCRVALRHRKTEVGPYELEIFDLCRGS